MATLPLFLQSSFSSLACSPPKLNPLKSKRNNIPLRVKCVVSPQILVEASRRSGNYHPSIWHYDLIQSLESDYNGEPYVDRAEELKREAKRLLEVTVEPLARLELIDKLQRLGIAYHFQEEINNALVTIFLNKMNSDDLHTTALHFRLLRQNGYKVIPDVFSNFMYEDRTLKSNLCGDVRGILSLYEASELGYEDVFSNLMYEDRTFKSDLCGDVRGMLSLYGASELGYEGESILDEVKVLSIAHLNSLMGQLEPRLASKVAHSLELPLHRWAIRLEARWYIDIYEEEEGMNPTLLELAKLDYNMVQAIHQREVKSISRWWRDHGLGEELKFARDRIMESFFWGIGFAFEPQLVECREAFAKIVQLVTTIDDIYDVYGSLEELEIFTAAVDRWDLKAMEQLPHYMKLCYLTLFNATNEAAYSVLEKQGFDCITYLKKGWADLCKAALVEAKWYNKGYTPTLEGYLENACISISVPNILVHAFFLSGHEITKEAIECLENHPKIVRCSAMILRLCDDMGTSKDEQERGDVQKSIQCYMKQASVSQEIAREKIKDLITNTWKKMNEECASSSLPFPQNFINICVNIARISQCMYQHGDGHGAASKETKERLSTIDG